MRNLVVTLFAGVTVAHLSMNAFYNLVTAVQYIAGGYPFAWQAWLYVGLCAGLTAFFWTIAKRL